MKNAKILYLALSVIAAGAFSSCTNEDDLGGASSASGELVYFPTTNATSYTLEETTTSVSIPVKRGGNTDAEYTVNILADFGDMAEADQGLFTVPSSVKFDAGKNESSITVGVNMSGVEEGKEYTIGFLLNDEENTSPYGNSSLYVTLASWPWTELGTGKYRDDWFTALWNVENVEIDVTIHESKTTKGLYMIENMYGWTFLEAAFEGSQEEITAAGYVVSYTPSNIIIDCSNPQQISIPFQSTGIEDADMGLCYILSLEGTYGTLTDGIITFPASGIAATDAEGYGYRANSSGLFRIVLPGYEAFDYSLTATYSGMRVGSDNETASAVVDFTYGEDVTGISYVIVNGDITSSQEQLAGFINGIVNGTAENVYDVENFTTGGENVSVEAALSAGNYTVIAVPEDRDGALTADNAAYVSFYFPAMEGSIATLSLHKVSAYDAASDHVSEYPDYNSMVYEITSATGVTSLKYYMNSTEIISESGMTAQQLVYLYGRDLPAETVSSINTTGKIWDLVTGMHEETSYTMIVEAQNAYGKALLVSEPFTTGEISYSGDLVVGEYTMICQREGEAQPSGNAFTVWARPDSETEFLVDDLGISNGARWYATYDPAASTLTLNGIEFGYEEYDNQFGAIYGQYDQTTLYGLASFASEESTGNDPCVFAVDAETKQLSALNTSLAVAFYDAGTSTFERFAVYFEAGENTTISYTGEESSETTSSVSTLNAGYAWKTIYGNSRLNSIRVAGADVPEMKPATMSVLTKVCEPLPKNDGHFRINADVRACDFIVK